MDWQPVKNVPHLLLGVSSVFSEFHKSITQITANGWKSDSNNKIMAAGEHRLYGIWLCSLRFWTPNVFMPSSLTQHLVMAIKVFSNVMLWYDSTKYKWIMCYSVQHYTMIHHLPQSAESFILVCIGRTDALLCCKTYFLFCNKYCSRFTKSCLMVWR